jgi:hypothetical protein
MLALIGSLGRLLRAEPLPEDAQGPVATFVLSAAIGPAPS